MTNNYQTIIAGNDFGESCFCSVLRRIRIGGVTTPVIIVGNDMSVERMREYYLVGASDFLNSPLSMNLLLLRLKINTQSEAQKPVSQYQIVDVEFFPCNRIVRKETEEILLTKKESELFELLVTNQNLVLSKVQIIDRVWTNNPELNENNIEVHISNLRKKLSLMDTKIQIQTVRNAGYCLRV